MLNLGDSGLSMIIKKMTPGKAVSAPSKFGGTVLSTSLSGDATADIRKELHGTG